MPELTGRKRAGAFIQRRIAHRVVVFIEIAGTGIVAAVAGAVLIAHAPGAQGMKLARGDHLTLQRHRAIEYEFDTFARNFAAFAIDVKTRFLTCCGSAVALPARKFFASR